MGQIILIVEDNLLNKKLFEDILKVSGYGVVSTDNPFDAETLAKEHQVDLVLMDIQLPEISGLDIIQAFRKDPDLKDLPIIAITAFAMKGDEQYILSQGASGYLSKPISVADLIKKVKDFLPEVKDIQDFPRSGTDNL